MARRRRHRRHPAFAPLIATELFALNNTSTPIVAHLLIVFAISVISVLLLPGKLGKADPLGLSPYQSEAQTAPTAPATTA